jgi:hypothetical protein
MQNSVSVNPTVMVRRGWRYERVSPLHCKAPNNNEFIQITLSSISHCDFFKSDIFESVKGLCKIRCHLTLSLDVDLSTTRKVKYI